MHGDGQGQPTPNTPLLQQQQQQGQYPQYGPSTPAAPPYYSPPPGYGVSPSQQQQQPPHPVIVATATTVRYVYIRPESFTGAIVYSCIVFWLINILFGSIAFILASEYMS